MKTWLKFKSLAAKKRLTMGKLFGNMLEEYEKNAEKTWDIILNSGKVLSDKEADDIKKITLKLRKERGFRDVSSF